ncbi:NAC domain-containing protein 2-like [Rosa rugosa]|uniref:NAC domain-containing protein 2-like n=1 Tax=Rosa rugosa TaxID=74645 RepID=UPI002B408E14|nr:NAC domain-containing protein 2-like [Rosa rugosa]
MEGFPVGVRFHPTDNELVSYYLHNKATMGDGFQSPYVSDCPDFYGKWEPWTVWDKYGGNSHVEDGEPLFFFTKRKKLNPNGTRFDRKMGTGTWSNQYFVKVVEEGKVIGLKRDFRYEGGSSSDQNNAWLMHEYELNKNDVTVLCTLRKKPTKPPPRGSETKKESVDENQRKRKLDEIVDDLEQDLDERRKLIRDLDQRRKLRANRPRKEETSCEEQGGSITIDHHQGSSSWTPCDEAYRPELVPDLATADDIVFTTYDFFASTPDDPLHVESNEFLDQFYEDNDFN